MCAKYNLVYMNTLSGMRYVRGTVLAFDTGSTPCWVLAYNLQVTGCHFSFCILIIMVTVSVMTPDKGMWQC
jgi:hypothetical protein